MGFAYTVQGPAASFIDDVDAVQPTPSVTDPAEQAILALSQDLLKQAFTKFTGADEYISASASGHAAGVGGNNYDAVAVAIEGIPAPVPPPADAPIEAQAGEPTPAAAPEQPVAAVAPTA